jgi:hypothetical protein
MDLNALPSSEEVEDEKPYEGPVGVQYAQGEHVETAVEIMRRVNCCPSLI